MPDTANTLLVNAGAAPAASVDVAADVAAPVAPPAAPAVAAPPPPDSAGGNGAASAAASAPAPPTQPLEPVKPKSKLKPRPSTLGRGHHMTLDCWDKMRRAWCETPTVAGVSRGARVSLDAARRAIHVGWPSQDLPPLLTIQVSETATTAEIHAAMRRKRQQAGDLAGTPAAVVKRNDPLSARREAVDRAAEEAMAARYGLMSATMAAEATARLAHRTLTLIEEGKLNIEEVTPKLIVQLTTAAGRAAEAVYKALQVERLRAGEPESVLGIRVGLLMDRADMDELRFVRDSGGRLPPRLVGLVAPANPAPTAPAANTLPRLVDVVDTATPAARDAAAREAIAAIQRDELDARGEEDGEDDDRDDPVEPPLLDDIELGPDDLVAP